MIASTRSRLARALGGVVIAVGVVFGIVAAMVYTKPGPAPEPVSPLTLFQERLKPGELAGWNLLFITLDTVRADHIGCYGYADTDTPTIDRLAARGAQFDHAVTSVPSTLPGHCTMMTGLEAPGHGVRINGHFLDDEVTTLAEVLKGEGYATAAFVGTYVLDARFGLGQGFDNYDDTLFRGDPKTGRGARPRRAENITDAVVKWLTRQFETHTDQPYFTWVHYFDPHLPYDPPGEFARRFADAPYDGEIAYTDVHIRRLLDFLEQRGQMDRTLIVLTSDHGEGLWEHLEEDHSRLIYDTTMHIPLIVSCPQLHDAPCRIDDVTVGAIDIMPTVLSLLGVKTDIDMDGIDLATTAVSRDRAIYVETLSPRLYHGWASLHGMRRIDAKYIQAPFPEYYDLANDRSELNNLLEADPHAADELAAELASYMAQWPTVDEFAATARPISAHEVQRLAALGYVNIEVSDGAQSATRPDPKDMLPVYKDLLRNNPVELNSKSRDIAARPDADKGAYRRAVILARAALARVPQDGRYQTTLGMAQYRAGNYEAAIETLTKLDEIASAPREDSASAAGAFRAMVLYQLGRTDQARAELLRLRTATEQTAQTEADAAQAFLAEAEALILKR